MENRNRIRNVCTGEIYRHFKGKLYQVIAIAKHSETGESLVIYQQLYGRYEVYARPLEMFLSEVDRVKYPEVTAKYRFELVNRDELEETEKCVSRTDKSDSDIPQEKIDSSSGEGVNPFLIKFLDADTYEEKRNILMRIKGEITDRLIDDIAASMDVAVEKGEIDERFASLLNCVDMMAKFEVTRFR